MPRCLLELLLAVHNTHGNTQCDAYISNGYCEHAQYREFMKKSCPGSCEDNAHPEEDEACVNWAAEGYCKHEQYIAYMQKSCPNACGFAPPDTSNVHEPDDAMYEGEHDDEMADDDMEEETEVDAATLARDGTESGPLGDEPEDCVAWAKQGLCEEGSSHLEYMRQKCPVTCERVAADSSYGDSSSVTDPQTCARWAMSGYCDESSAHRQFMKLHCAEACEAYLSRDPNAGVPPPADLWLVPLLLAFGAGTMYTLRRTLAADSYRSTTVARM